MGILLEGKRIVVMKAIRKCHNAVMKDAERAVTRVMIDDL